MRFIIVGREVPAVAGYLCGPSDVQERKVKPRSLRSPLELLPAFRVANNLKEARIAKENDLIQQGFDDGVRLCALALADARAHPGESAVLGARYVPDTLLPHPWDFERECLTIGAEGRALLPHDSPVFLGKFRDYGQYDAVLSADGGASRVHIFNSDVAQRLFRRHGNGILEDGAYLLHPKRDKVLVPFATFHAEMLQEMTREAHVLMGRIGAKQLVVETVEGVTFSGKVVSGMPLKASVEVEYDSEQERTVTFRWGSPTYQPDEALTDCVWIQDNAGLMTIVDQRQTSNLIHFDKFTRTNTSFNVSLDIHKAFRADFEWTEESTYRYRVEFFEKPT